MNNGQEVQKQALDYLLAQSAIILAEALKNNWESVCTLQLARDDTLRHFFTETIVVERNVVVDAINQMINGDKQVALLCREEQKKMQQQVVKMKLGRNAVKAYSA